MTIGIYALRFNNTDKVYIGKSKNIENRLDTHLYKMRKGLNSKRLNEAFSLYGTPILEVLCECQENELDSLEEEAIEIFNSVTNGFNTLKLSGTNGVNYNTGEKHPNSKYTNDDILRVFYLLIDTKYHTFEEISIQTGVACSVIADISKGDNHKWLESIDSQGYKVLLNQKANRRSIGNISGKIPKILSPNGEIFSVHNIRAFAKAHGLQQTHIVQLFKGRGKSHKGWKPVVEDT